MSVETKDAIDRLGTLFETFKGNLKNRVDTLEKAQTDQITTLKNRFDEFEAQLNEPVIGGDVSTKAASWEDEAGRVFKVATKRQRLCEDHKGPRYPFGEMVKGAIGGNPSEYAKTQMVSIDSQGGYTLPRILSDYVIDMARDASVLAAAGCVSFSIPEGIKAADYIQQTSDPVVSWVPERGDFTESDATWGLLTVKPKKCGVLIEITREMLESFNFVSMLEGAARKAIAAEIDRVLLLGSGAGVEPIGLSNVAGIETIESVGSPTYDDVLNAVKLVRNGNFAPNGAIWSPTTDYSLSILRGVEDGQYLAPPAAYTQLQKFITAKAGNTLAFVGQWNQLGWVFGGQGGNVRVELGTINDSFKRDCIYMRLVISVDTICLNPAAFCMLSGIS